MLTQHQGLYQPPAMHHQNMRAHVVPMLDLCACCRLVHVPVQWKVVLER